MAIAIKSLGSGTVTSSGTAHLYVVPAAKSAVVNNIRLVNGGGAVTPALNLYVMPSGGTARRIYKRDFTIPNTQPNATLLIQDLVTLGQGDEIQLVVTTGLTLAYTVNGVERS